VRYLATVVLLAACGGNGGGTPIDARPDAVLDAPADTLPDAPPDAPPLDAPAPQMGHHHYVIDSLLVPTNNNEARAYGQDLNGDLTIDNQLGMVLATLEAQGFEIQGTTTQSVDRGTTITLIDLGADDFTTAPAATFAMFVGANPMPPACANAADTTCRHHLTGSATFTIPPAAPTHPALQGTIATGTYTTSPAGLLAAPLPMFPASTPVVVNLVGAKVVATQLSATGIMSLKIGGAVTSAEMDANVYPAMHDGFAAIVAHDCTALTSPPMCGCPAGSNGKTWIDLLDMPPKDCKISVQEIKDNSLFMSLFAPDVVIGGQMALSVGFKATAVEAGFVAP
jgi:hypothetical protein